LFKQKCGSFFIKEVIMKKRRGAQPGNKNAYKQGFYSTQIPEMEWDLELTDQESLKSEIDAVRVLMLRLSQAMQEPDPNLKDPDAPLRILLLASRRLDILLTIQNELSDPLPRLAQYHRDRINDPNTASDLYTAENLLQAGIRMFGIDLMKDAPPKLVEKLDYILKMNRMEEEIEWEAQDEIQ
jgi:hypothetical protein